MLSSLTIQNLVVIREISLDFSPGLSVLTGETGAGKSVLINAISLALGGRAESQLVRDGAERAQVSVSFDLAANSAALAYLREHELDHGNECVLRRVVNRDGRSKAYCNGSAVTLQSVKALASKLVDIHAQHASVRLLDHDYQRQLLDAYQGHDELVATTQTVYEQWHRAADALARQQALGADQAKGDLLRYQLEELNAANVDSEDIDALEGEHRQLAHITEYQTACAEIAALIDGDDNNNAHHALSQASSAAAGLEKHVPAAANLRAALSQAEDALSEAISELAALSDSLNADPARFEALDRRIAELHQLARKHHVALADLSAHAAGLAAELHTLEHQHEKLHELEQALSRHQLEFDQSAAALSESRQQAAAAMAKDISARLGDLGIPHARFEAVVTPNEDTTPRPYGADRVEFRVATNPEQQPRSLNKVASGGELSRIALAIQAATASHSRVPVVIYDEVDSGIGGATANIVGRNLRTVAAYAQVICITHSPQVAGAGDQHLRVEKQVIAGTAQTHLTQLDTSERETEIARMLGATRSTDASLEHARDLLSAAQSHAS